MSTVNSPVEKYNQEELTSRFTAFANALTAQLGALRRFHRNDSAFFKQTCARFLTHFSPLSQPVLYMEFNNWHQTMIHNDNLVQLLGDRLLYVASTNLWREETLILKILGVLMRNPASRTSLQRNGAIQTLMDIVQRIAPVQPQSPAKDVNLPAWEQYHVYGPTAAEEKQSFPNINDENLNALNRAFSSLSLGAGVANCDVCHQCPPRGVGQRRCSPRVCPNTPWPVDYEHNDAREEACIVLRRLALDMPPARDICRLNGIVVFLGIISNRANSLEFRDKACAVLGNSFCSVDEKVMFATLNGFQTLLQAMHDSIPYTHYLEVYCRAIANAIANCPQNKIAFAQQGGITLILDVLHSQPLQSDFLAMALRVLTNASRSTAGMAEISRNNGMRRLIELCWRIDNAEAVDRKTLMVKNSFSDVELLSSEAPTSPRVKSSVDRGILFCLEEYIYEGNHLKEFYENKGLDALIWVMRREYRNAKVLQYACKTAREVICASQGLGHSEGSRTPSSGYHDYSSFEELAQMWMKVIDEAVVVVQSYPYYGEYAAQYTLVKARQDTRDTSNSSCDAGCPAKRVRFHYCNLIEDIVRWFPVRGAKHVNRIYFDALKKTEDSALRVLPDDLVKLLCEFLPIQEWTC